MKRGCLVVAVLLLSGCAEKLPTTPSSPQTPGPQAGVASRIELTASPGTGSEAGGGTITARVFDGLSTALSEKTVTFTASAGTLSANQAVTDENGFARSTITGPEGPITIVAAVGALEQKTLIAIQALPPAPLPPGTPPPPAPPPLPPPPPPPPGPSYSVSIGATPLSLAIGDTSTLTATATATNGATGTLTYAWDCNADGTFDAPIAANTMVCTYTTVGTTASAVRVASATATGVGSVSVTVVAAPALFVSIGAPTPAPAVNTTLTFSATVTSTGPIPPTLQWEWDTDGDGDADIFETGASPKSFAFTFSSTGQHTLKLTVRDPPRDRSASTSRGVTVP